MGLRVGVIGAGAAGLITAKTLLEDGFNVQVLTRDSSAGGVWAKHRVYPGLYLNNMHGEYRFSSLPMPAPRDAGKTGGRLDGDAMQNYFETFAARLLDGRIRFEVEVLNIKRGASGNWAVLLRDSRTNSEELEYFDKIVLCTGGCSCPNIPESLSPASAREVGFKGHVFHSSQFRANIDRFDESVNVKPNGGVLVVGGGKSAQDIVAYAVGKGHKVTMIFTNLTL